MTTRPPILNMTADEYYNAIDEQWIYGIDGSGNCYVEGGAFGIKHAGTEWHARIVDRDDGGVKIIPKSPKTY